MKTLIRSGRVSAGILILNVFIMLVYFSWWFNPAHIDNPWLYGLLFIGEIYHVIMASLFWLTVWPSKRQITQTDDTMTPSVDIYITVAGESVAVVKKTALAARDLDYPNHQVYLLNDGFVAKKDNWQEIEQLAKELKINCLTRRTPGGAKAGNINHALRHTQSEIVVIFDADMVPQPDFLTKVIPYFADAKVGFVQTPQYYHNHQTNNITGGAWEQQELFFGPIMIGKEKSNAAFICGTNVAIRRTALEEVGGMNEKNIAEDFLTSLYIHQRGWKSIYLPEVLAQGLAPEDFLAYFKQQLRWARGSLEVLFGHNPLLKRGLSFTQKLEYLSSALYYFGGLIVLIDALTPLMFLFFGIQPVSATTTSFALFFVPFIMANLYTLFIASNGSFSFRAIAFSYSSWTLQITALVSVLLRQKMAFAITPKEAQTGNFISLVYPHLIYTAAAIIGAGVAIWREGVNPSVVTNIAWAIFNVIIFAPFIYSAINWGGLLAKQPAKAVRP